MEYGEIVKLRLDLYHHRHDADEMRQILRAVASRSAADHFSAALYVSRLIFPCATIDSRVDWLTRWFQFDFVFGCAIDELRLWCFEHAETSTYVALSDALCEKHHDLAHQLILSRPCCGAAFRDIVLRYIDVDVLMAEGISHEDAVADTGDSVSTCWSAIDVFQHLTIEDCDAPVDASERVEEKKEVMDRRSNDVNREVRTQALAPSIQDNYYIIPAPAPAPARAEPSSFAFNMLGSLDLRNGRVGLSINTESRTAN